MADTREFFKMDVGYFDNPKVQAIIDEHPRAVLLHMRCIAYARQHRTDGLVPLRVALRSIGADASGIASGNATYEAARNAGLLCDAPGGNTLVHDYAEHQQTTDELKLLSLRQSKNARARWSAKRDASGNASGIATGNASGNAEKRREDTTSELRPDVAGILDLLDACIRNNGAKVPSRSKANIAAARLLLDNDGRPLDEVRRVIEWATSDSFWKSNILSMSKLRDKYDQLRLRSGAAERRDGATLVAMPGGGRMEKFW